MKKHLLSLLLTAFLCIQSSTIFAQHVFQITESISDATENAANGTMVLASLQILGVDSSMEQNSNGFLFSNVDIPSSIQIQEAYLSFTTTDYQSGFTDIFIYAETDAPQDYQVNQTVSGRSLTSNWVSWHIDQNWNWTMDGTVQTPDLSMIVNEVIQSGNWNQGDPINFILLTDPNQTITGFREIKSFDGSGITKLVINEGGTTQMHDCYNPLIVNTGSQQIDFPMGETWLQFNASINGLLDISTCDVSNANNFQIEIIEDCQSSMYIGSQKMCTIGGIYTAEIQSAKKYMIRVQNSLAMSEMLDFTIAERIPSPGETCNNAIDLPIGASTNVTFDANNLIKWFTLTPTTDANIKLIPDNAQVLATPPNVYVYDQCGSYTSLPNVMVNSTDIDINNLPAGLSCYIKFEYYQPPSVLDFAIEVQENPITIPEGSICHKPIMITAPGSIPTTVNSAQYEYWFAYQVQSESIVEISTCNVISASDYYFNVAFDCSNMNMPEYTDSDCSVGKTTTYTVKPGDILKIQLYNSMMMDTSFSWQLTERAPNPGEICSSAINLPMGTSTFEARPGSNYLTFYNNSNNQESVLLNLSIFDSMYDYVTIYESCDMMGNMIYPDVNGNEISFFAEPNKAYKIKIDYNNSIIAPTNVDANIRFRISGETCNNPLEMFIGGNTATLIPGINYLRYNHIRYERDSMILTINELTSSDTAFYVHNCSFTAYDTLFNTGAANRLFIAEQNNEYIIAVQVNGISVPTNITFNLERYIKPGSECENPLQASIGQNQVYYEPGETDVWYTYTATTNGFLEISVCDQGTYPNVFFQNNCFNGDIQSENKSCPSGNGNIYSIAIQDQTTYYIQVSENNSTNLSFDLQEKTAGPGETCGLAINLDIAQQTVSFPTDQAFWQTISVPTDEFNKVIVSIDNEELSQMGYNFEVYEDCNYNMMLPVDWYGNTMEFFTEKGKQYFIRWYVYGSQGTQITSGVNVTLMPYTPPPGKYCSDPIIVNEPGSYPLEINNNAQWFQYTPSVHGFMEISTCQYGGESIYYQIFQNCDTSWNSGETCNYMGNNYHFINANTSVLIRFDQNYASPGMFDLKFTPNNSTKIYSFSSPLQTGPAIIDLAAKTIQLEVAQSADRTNLNFSFVVGPQAQLSEVDDSRIYYSPDMIDVSTSKNVKVTAANGTDTETYTLIVTNAATKQTGKEIISLKVAGGTVTKYSNNITIAIPAWTGGYLFTDYVLSPLATLKDINGNNIMNHYEHQFNIGETQVWKVTAEDGSSKLWNIQVIEAPGSSCSVPIFANKGVNISSPQANQELWYKYTAGTQGKLIVSLCGVNDVYIDIMKDCNLNNAYFMNKDCSNGGSEYIVDGMKPGDTYYIRLHSYTSKSFEWIITEQAPLPGETCMEPAQAIWGENSIPQTYTSDIIYYDYQATKNGILIIDACSDYNQIFIDGIYEGCNAPPVMDERDHCDNGNDNISIFETEIGKIYKIVLHINNVMGTSMPISWTLTELELLKGEACSQPLVANEGTNTAFPYGDRGLGATFYNYTATGNGVVNVSNCGTTNFNSEVFIVSDSCNMQEILAYNDDFCLTQSSASFDVVAGTNYMIIWETVDLVSTFNWNLTFYKDSSLAPGSSCDNPAPLSVGTNMVTANGSLLWMEYTATVTGFVDLVVDITPDILPYVEESELIVLESCEINMGVETSHPNASSLEFYAEAGQTYKLLWIFNTAAQNVAIAAEVVLNPRTPEIGELCSSAEEITATPATIITANETGKYWYSYTPSEDGIIVASSCGSYNQVEIYHSCIHDYMRDNKDDNDGSNPAPCTVNEMDVLQNETYYIVWYSEPNMEFEWNLEFYPNNEARFLSFNIEEALQTTISGNTITSIIGQSYALDNLTPTFTVAPRVQVFIDDVPQQGDGTIKQNFSSNVIYKLIAADGSEHFYTVTATSATMASDTAAIETFELQNQTSISIDNTTKQIYATVAWWNTNNCLQFNKFKTTPLTKVETPNNGFVTIDQNFNYCWNFGATEIWKLHAENGNIREYSITVERDPTPVGMECNNPVSISSDTSVVYDGTRYFSFTPPSAGFYSISLLEPLYQSSHVNIYENDCMNPIKDGEITSFDGQTLIFNATAGTNYIIEFNNNLNYFVFSIRPITISVENDITRFEFSRDMYFDSKYMAAIDFDTKTITKTVPFGMNLDYIYLNLVLSNGATAYIGNNQYARGITYKLDTLSEISVVAMDGTPAVWNINIKQEAPNSEANFLSFYISNQIGQSVIDTTANTVNITMPEGYDLSALTPYFGLSSNAMAQNTTGTIQLSGVSKQDFRSDVTYEVFAQNGNSKIWNVHVATSTVPLDNFIVPGSVTITKGIATPFFVNFIPANASNKALDISVDDLNVVSINQGTLIGLSEDTTIVRFSSIENPALVQTMEVIVVLEYVALQGIGIPSNIELNTGFEYKIYPSLYPVDASNKTLDWHVDDNSIADVLTDGTVIGKSVGTTTIWATARDTILSSNQCIVEVLPLEVTEVRVNISDIILDKGESFTGLQTTVLPINASDKQILYTSSDESIAIVDTMGKITALEIGEVEITVSSASNPDAFAKIHVAVMDVIVDKTALVASITNAETLRSSAIVGTAKGEYSQESVDALNASIADAQTVADDVNASNSMVNAATANLQDAIILFSNSKIGNIKVQSVSIIRDSLITRLSNDPIALNAVVSPTNATYQQVLWYSANPSIVSVTATGVVDGVSPGQTYVYAKAKDDPNTSAIDSCRIKIITPVSTIKVTDMISIVQGNTTLLAYSVLPSDADNKAVTFTSSKPTVATVDASGYITAISVGVAQITVKALDNGKTAVCIVNVVSEAIPVESISIITEKQLVIGDEYTLATAITPLNATNKNVVWSSSNEQIAYVNQSGLVKSFSTGTASIVATTADGAFSDTCLVTVVGSQPPTIIATDSIQVQVGSGEIAISIEDIVWDDNSGLLDLTVAVGATTNFTITITDSVIKLNPVDVAWIGTEDIIITVTDSDGLSSELTIPVTISNVANTAPVFTQIPSQTIRTGGIFNEINCNAYVSDDYTKDAHLTWSVNTPLNLAAIITGGFLTIDLIDPEWVGDDSIVVTVADIDGLTATTKIMVSVSSAANMPPVISAIPAFEQDNTVLYVPINLNDYVVDDYTKDQNILWSLGATNKLNVEIVNNYLIIAVADETWTGTENILLIAYDEDYASDSTIFSFTQKTLISDNWKYTPEIEFTAQATIAGVMQDVAYNATLTGADSWMWEFEGASYASGEQFKTNPVVQYENAGIYTVKLYAENSYGTDSLVKTDYITILGIEMNNTTICEGSSITLAASVLDTDTYSFAWSTGDNTPTIAVTPDVDSTFSVTITKGFFQYTDAVLVSIADSLDLGTDVELCAGESLLVQPTGFVEYNWGNTGWRTDSTSAQISTTGSIELAVRDAFGCESADIISVTAVNPLPTIDLGNDIEICEGTATVLDAGAGFTYAWNTSETTQTISVNADGKYTVTITDASMCANEDSVQISVFTPIAEELAVVTYSETSPHVIVAWQKSANQRIAEYKVLRETGVLNVYDTIGSKTFAEDSYFIDNDANTQVKSFRYKLVTIDSTCKARKESTPHRTMHLQNSVSSEGTVNLSWNKYEGIVFDSYIISKGTSSADVTILDTITSDGTSWTSPDKFVDGDIYRVSIVLPFEIDITQLKSDSGPFSQSLSNLSEAQLTSTRSFNIECKVYPTPANDELFVIVETNEALTAKIINNTGAVAITSIAIENGSNTIDVSDLAQGTYTLIIESKKGLVSKKIVIK